MQSDTTVASPRLSSLAHPVAHGSPSIWQRAWEGWKRIAHVIGVFQTRLIMLLFFFLFVLPLGMILRLVRDPLHLAHPPKTNWVEHPHDAHDLDSARQQF